MRYGRRTLKNLPKWAETLSKRVLLVDAGRYRTVAVTIASRMGVEYLCWGMG